jgi:hypothetical protein
MRRQLTARRALLLLVVLPAVAVVRYVDHEPTQTIVGVVGLAAVAVGIALVVLEAARRRSSGDERRTQDDRGASHDTSGGRRVRTDRPQVLLGALATFVVIAIIAVVLLLADA